jgi:hypothetical protein
MYAQTDNMNSTKELFMLYNYIHAEEVSIIPNAFLNTEIYKNSEKCEQLLL